MEQAGGAALRRVAANGLQAGVKFPLAQTIPRRLGHRQIMLDLTQLAVAVHDQLDGGLVATGGLLGDVGDLPARRHQDLPGVRVQLPHDEGEEARLAAAVGPHQAELLAGIDGEIGVLQQPAGTAAQFDVTQLQHDDLGSAFSKGWGEGERGAAGHGMAEKWVSQVNPAS